MILSSPVIPVHAVVIQFAVNKMEPLPVLVLRDTLATLIWVVDLNVSQTQIVHQISNVIITNVETLVPASVELMHNVMLRIIFQIVLALKDIPEILDQIAMK